MIYFIVLLKKFTRTPQIPIKGASFDIAQNPSLRYLSIASNQINHRGIAALSQNTTLNSLDLSYNLISNTQAMELVKLSNVAFLNLSYEQILVGRLPTPLRKILGSRH